MQKQNKMYAIGAVTLLAAYRAYIMGVSFIGSDKSSGWKYNNVGNIRPSTRKFSGELGTVNFPTSGNFRIFKSYYYGARAYCNLLQDVYLSQGRDTIREIITKYAPPSENDTERYIRDVSAWSGLGENEIIKFSDKTKFLKLAAAMCRKETGKKESFLPSIFSAAWFDAYYLGLK